MKTWACPLHQLQHCWPQSHQAGDKSEHCQPYPHRVRKDPAKSNSEASREVFNVSLISFRGAQMNSRLKPCKKMNQKWAPGSCYDKRLISEGPKKLICFEWLTEGAGKRKVSCCSCLSQCYAALSSPTPVNPWSSGSQIPHFPVPLDSNRTPELRNPLHHGFLQMRILSSVSGNSHLVSTIGHNCEPLSPHCRVTPPKWVALG